MANTLEEFVNVTNDALVELHREIWDTATRVVEANPKSDDGENTPRNPDDLRKDLLAMVIRALLDDGWESPTYDLRLVPEWAHGEPTTLGRRR